MEYCGGGSVEGCYKGILFGFILIKEIKTYWLFAFIIIIIGHDSKN